MRRHNDNDNFSPFASPDFLSATSVDIASLADCAEVPMHTLMPSETDEVSHAISNLPAHVSVAYIPARTYLVGGGLCVEARRGADGWTMRLLDAWIYMPDSIVVQ